MNISEIKEKIIKGYLINKKEAMQLLEVPLDELCSAADEIRQHFCGNRFDACTIINVKSGKCSEDCVFCAQSSHYDTNIDTYPLMSKKELLEHSLSIFNMGFMRVSYVASGRKISDEEFDDMLDVIRELRDIDENYHICVSLGLLSKNEIVKLKSAGVTRIHCNLESSENYFPHVCSTHSFADKTRTIGEINCSGMMLCSGGIFGLGESFEDRIDLAFSLRDLGARSIPINVLNPIIGTPVGDNDVLSNDVVCRIVAVYRFINPGAFIRMAGGRNLLGDHGRRAFMSGCNSAILGNMLTTLGVSFVEDVKMIEELGFEFCYSV